MTDVDSDLPPMSKSELHQEVMRYRRQQKDAIPKLVELRKQEATLRAERDELREEIKRRDQAWMDETKTNEQVVEQATGQYVPLAIPKHMVSEKDIKEAEALMQNLHESGVVAEERAALNRGDTD